MAAHDAGPRAMCVHASVRGWMRVRKQLPKQAAFYGIAKLRNVRKPY